MVLHTTLKDYAHVFLPANPSNSLRGDEMGMSFPFPIGSVAASDGEVTLMEVSYRDVQKYLEAWISYLQSTNDSDSDQLVSIAEKHLQNLQKSLLNSKIHTPKH